ncbi:DNA-binding protein [Bacillus cytotoxicus]
MQEIDNYMTPTVAAYIYGISANTIRNKLKEGYSKKGDKDREYLIEQGLLRCYGNQRKEWIIHRKAIEYWFPEKIKSRLD